MALYEKAKRLELLHPEYKDKYIFRIGEFHTVLCAIRAIGSFIENSGIDDAWIAADMYGPSTTRQILEGKHMKRAINAHLTTLLVFFKLYQHELFKEHPELDTCSREIQSLMEASASAVNDTEQVAEVRGKHHKLIESLEEIHLVGAMEEFDRGQRAPFKFARSYMDAVLALLSFIRATRLGLWDLHLASLDRLCVLFFARDRLKYAQMVPGYIAEMYSLQSSDPEMWQEFQKGNFSVNKNVIPFCSIGVDHAIEHVNRMMKVKGGLSGITLKPTALARFFLVAPVMSRLSEQVHAMSGVSTQQHKKHQKLSPSVTRHQVRRVARLQCIIEDCNPFREESDSLVNIVTQAVMPKDVQADILRSDEAGKQRYDDFVATRIVGPVSPWEKMTKLNLLIWKSASKTTKVKFATHVVELKENRSLFARLLVVARSRPEVDLQIAIGMYEFSCIPRSLFASDGSLLACLDKSKLMAILEAPTLEDSEPRHFNVNQETAADNVDESSKTLVIDGMAVVQELSTVSVKTCAEFAQHFVRTVEHRATHYDNIHLVFDRYDTEQSLKQRTRRQRYGKDCDAYHFVVNDTTQLKVPLKKFLSNNKTKDSLTIFLATKSLAHFDRSDKGLVVSTKNGAKSTRGNIADLSSNHEEADTLVILHALYAASRGDVVHIMSPDTDVFVLAVRRQRLLGDEACVIIGTGDKRRIVPIKPVYDAIGSDLAGALPGFHAFTGSDVTGKFSGKGKTTCWNTLKASKLNVLQAFAQLGKSEVPTEEMFAALEEFVCRLYCPRSTVVDIGVLRWHLFKKCQAEAEKLPPTLATLRNHILRAHYQSMIWVNDSTVNPVIPSPLGYGWSLEGNSYKAITTDLPPAPTAVVELVKCGCATSKCSTSACSCRKHGLSCTELCVCESVEDLCDNRSDDKIRHDEGSDDADESEDEYE